MNFYSGFGNLKYNILSGSTSYLGNLISIFSLRTKFLRATQLRGVKDVENLRPGEDLLLCVYTDLSIVFATIFQPVRD